jgi:hypothetical protein
VRLLLDAHVSGRSIGRRLAESGHDVRALDREPKQEGLEDDDVLELATQEDRILVTHNVADFPQILREWGGEGRSHAGVIVLYGIDPGEFGLVRAGIERWLALRPRPDDWIDFPAILDREFAASSDR